MTAEVDLSAHDIKVGKVYDMVITEQEKIVKTYDQPPVKKTVSGQQYFRGQIKESQKQLFPFLNATKIISFDQSYYTRTLGQIEIQKRFDYKNFDIASGSGFGVLQALWFALGWDSEDLQRYVLSGLRKAIKKGAIKGSFDIMSRMMFNSDTDRLPSSNIEKSLRKVFMFEKNDLKVRDLKLDIFIPIMDISGRVIVFNKKEFSATPLYVVAACAMLDPIFFKTKPMIKEMGVLNGDIAKNNDVFIARNNPRSSIISIGSPVRCYDKGYSKMTRESMSLKATDQRHETDLMFSTFFDNITRYECQPIDEIYQFSTKDNALEKALNSGNINV